MNEKQELLKSILTMVDKSVTKEEFLKAYKTLVEFVVKIEKRNGEEMDGMWKTLDKRCKEMECSTSDNFSTLKDEVNEIVKDQITSLYSKYNKLTDEIQQKMGELRNGEDADEQRVAEIVLSKMPQPEEKDDETAEELRDKLETLTGDERIDKSAIKGIDEVLEELKKTGKATFTTGGSRPIQIWDDGTVIDKNFRVLNFKGTAITSITRQKDGTVDITIDSTPGGGTEIWSEAVSGSDTTFTLSETPLSGTLRVYGYGQRLKVTEDYTLAGKIITTVNSFSAGSILADYKY